MRFKKSNIWAQKPTYLSNQAGFTLIEFMIASALSMLIIIAVATTYSATSKMKRTAELRLALQQDLRSAGEQIIRDARMAGSFGCFNSGNLITKAQAVDDNSFSSQYENNGIKYRISEEDNSGIVTYGFDADKDVAAAVGQKLVNSLNATGFTVSNDRVIAFTYGLNATSIDVAKTNSDTAVISNANNNNNPNALALFNWVKQNGPVALSSCNRLYLSNDARTTGSNIEIKNSTNIAFDSNFNTNTFNQSQTMLSQLYSVAYAVGTVGSDNSTQGLYKFTMDSSGNWDGPQLVSLNVTNMEGEIIYSQCSDNKTDAEFSSIRDKLQNTGRKSTLPALIELYLTLNNDDANVEKRGNVTDYIIRASVRGGSICSDS